MTNAQEQESERLQLARETARRVSGAEFDTSAREHEPPEASQMRALFYEHAFADSWSRTALDDRSRSLVTIAALAALGAGQELRNHMFIALRLGVTPAELVDVCIQIGVYAGVPRGGAAWSAAEYVLERRASRD